MPMPLKVSKPQAVRVTAQAKVISMALPNAHRIVSKPQAVRVTAQGFSLNLR